MIRQCCVVIPFRGVESPDEQKRFVQLPQGAILTSRGYQCRDGLIPVSWDGREIWVFAEDLESRTNFVITPSQPSSGDRSV
jgi:hypothetical protein